MTNIPWQLVPKGEDRLYLFQEAMGYLRVSRSTLYCLMRSKWVTGYKVGGTWRFYRKDLDACIVQKTGKVK